MKVLLEGKESMPLTSNIVRCMKDWVSAIAASSSREVEIGARLRGIVNSSKI